MNAEMTNAWERGDTVITMDYKEFVWDPTESVATKPLCFRQHNQSDAYLMHDGNKNVTDVERIARPRKNFRFACHFHPSNSFLHIEGG